MKIYKVDVTTLSPLVITEKVGWKGFVYKLQRYKIPASQFRGALLTKLLIEGLLSEEQIYKLNIDPDFALTPMYITDGDRLLYKDLLIAHALCFKPKWKFPGELFDIDGRISPIISLGIEEVINRLKSGVELKCVLYELLSMVNLNKYREWSHGKYYFAPGEDKPCGGALALKIGRNLWTNVSLEGKTGTYIEVGIDHIKKTAFPGLIYAYEFIKPGCKFTGLLTCSDSSPLVKIIREFDYELELSVGRGISRGFGRIHAKFNEISLSDIVLSQGVSLNNHDLIAFECIDIAFRSDYTKDYPLFRPYKTGDEIIINSNWIKKFTQIEANLRFKVVGVLGGSSKYYGWSLKTCKPKLPLLGNSPGSLLICRAEGVEGSSTRILSLLPLVGINRWSSYGYNILLPLVSDPFLIFSQLLRGGEIV